ncbi:helix-turn-helix domain-containing protein [Bosea sp. (in: a-proteobacteria)]|uniref:sigma-54-dependent Fis family transcriptional regulator n=1 Tax=Bosea sp. (in: a-proteobacteria) TaxID=1871050 RepID=UPI00333FE452
MRESIQKEDWERFHALGRVPPSVREVVLRSWVRSQEKSGLETLQHAPTVPQGELHAIRHHNARLRSAAQSAIRRVGYMLDDSGAMLLLCDANGVVMDAAGDARTLRRGEENHLHPGGHWDEGAIGTNAIGTALHLGKPVTILGVEHFCEAIQRWSCAAAPIKDPFNGRVLGAVDISGPSGEAFGPIPALSVTLALQIEEALRNASLQEQQRLIEKLLARRSLRAGDEVMVLDRHGRPVWTSGAFDAASRNLIERPEAWRGLTAEGDGDPHRLAERMRGILPEAEVDVLGEHGQAVSVIVTLPRRARRTPPAAQAGIALRQIAETGPELAGICAQAAKLFDNGIPLLIEGAVGSGKETLALALHAGRPQATLPFEIVDCSLLDDERLRSDLSGGTGFMRLAETGGTLCLDELAETPPQVQPLLAQALAHLSREGAAQLRIVTLSSVSLAERMAGGGLRGELLFRAAGAGVRLPALSERRQDIAGLVRCFCERYAGHRSGKPIRFTPAAMMRLQVYGWPGNLRELRNLIEALSATSLSRLIDVSDLPPGIATAAVQRREETLRDRERTEILNTVAEADGNMAEAARRLGISRSTLYLKLDQYGVPRSRRN